MSGDVIIIQFEISIEVCQLLLEWGVDSGALDFRGHDYLFDVKLEKMKDFLRRFDERRMRMIPKIKNGDKNEMLRLLEDHEDEIVRLIDLEALCVNGTSLLHVAAHFNDLTAIEVIFLTTRRRCFLICFF